MSLRTRRGLALLASLLFVAAACTPVATSPSPTGAAATPTAAGTPTETAGASPTDAGGTPDLFGTEYSPTEGTPGGTLIVGDWQEATLWQPFYQGQVTEANVSGVTFIGLVTSTDDFKYAPELAADIPTLDGGGVTLGEGGDAMTVTWELRDGLKWSDGEALDCDDFAYTQEWIMDPDNTGLFGGITGYEDISELECASPTEIVMHFENIYEGYITLFSYVLPEHYLSEFPVADQVTGAGMAAADMPTVPTNGPFKFESVTSGSELRLVRNDNYQNPRGGQAAYLDGMIFKWYADADAMIAGYKAGEIDIATDLNDADIPKVEDLGDQVHAYAALTYEFLRPNWSAEICSPRVTDRGDGCPMSDPAMREALKYAIDKDEINTRLLGGNAEVAHTNTSPSAWYYTDPGEVAGFDPDQAAQILDDAGWTVGSDGIREKDGLKASIELCTTTRQVRQDTLALVSSWLQDIGIQSTVNAVSPDDIFATHNEATEQTPCNLSRGVYDLAEHAFSVPLDPLSNYGVYHSTQVPPASQNDSRIDNADIDAALDTVKGTVDFAEVREAMATFQEVYVAEAVEVPLYYRKNVELVQSKVQNFTGNPSTLGPYWNAQDFWIQE